MAGNACEFINCDRTRRTVTKLKMYRFPKDSSRAKQWIINSGNALLVTFADEDLQRRFVCEHHFDDEHFINPQLKHRLKPSAVPRRWDTVKEETAVTSQVLKVQTPSRTYSKQNTKRKFYFHPDDKEHTSSESDGWLPDPVNLPSLSPSHYQSSPEVRQEDPCKRIAKLESIIETLKKRTREANHKMALQRTQIWKLKQIIKKMRMPFKTTAQLQNYKKFNFCKNQAYR